MTTVECIIEGPVARVWLNRAEVRNAFNPEMIAHLSDLFMGFASEPQVRVVVLGGRGPAFSAGADIHWMRSMKDFSWDDNVADAKRMNTMFDAIDSCPVPVVVRIQGAALGGGAGLAAVGDIVICEDKALLGFTEIKLGIAPCVISTYVVPKIGLSQARRLFLTGERFSAALAQQLGLVHLVSAAEDLDAVVQTTVAQLLSSAPGAAATVKQLLRSFVSQDKGTHEFHNARRIAALRTGPEGQEGMQAFLDKRKPGWNP